VNWLLVLAAGLLVLVIAFFVIAEYSLLRSRHSRLELASEQRLRGARLALWQLEHFNEYITTCQVGNTMASIGIGAIGEPALAHLFEGALGNAGGHVVAIVISVGVAYLLLSAAQITVGEMVPKLYAIDRAERVARLIARPLQLCRILFNPIIVVLTVVSNAILAVLGVDPDRRIARGGAPDELKLLIRESEAGGTLETNEASMLSGVFHLHERHARQVMTPIPAVVTVDLSEDVQTALWRCIDSGHTRLVVTDHENQDHVRGGVHATALARQLLDVGPDAPIESLVRDAPIVPETKPLDDLLAELQRERAHLAVVADEYGGVVGIVTIEDIVEQVVGEISDETYRASGDIRQLPNGDWFVRGHVPVADLAAYGIDLPAGNDTYNSIGGFLFSDLGRLPSRGDKISVNGYELRVESVRANRVALVRVREHRGAANEQEPTPDASSSQDIG
jgi:CBS domain containing-hemolysin-like protein